MPADDNRQFLMAVASLGLAISVAFAQNQRASVPPPRSIIGTVEAISGNVIYVKTGLQLVALTADERTEVGKGKVFHNLSPVTVGDDIAARCRIDASGKLLAAWMS